MLFVAVILVLNQTYAVSATTTKITPRGNRRLQVCRIEYLILIKFRTITIPDEAKPVKTIKSL